jgi:hypothetical protein
MAYQGGNFKAHVFTLPRRLKKKPILEACLLHFLISTNFLSGSKGRMVRRSKWMQKRGKRSFRASDTELYKICRQIFWRQNQIISRILWRLPVIPPTTTPKLLLSIFFLSLTLWKKPCLAKHAYWYPQSETHTEVQTETFRTSRSSGSMDTSVCYGVRITAEARDFFLFETSIPAREPTQSSV